MQVRLCRTKNTGEIFALKKLRKLDMLRQGQVEHVRFERNLLVEVDKRIFFLKMLPDSTLLKVFLFLCIIHVRDLIFT
ncbi:unnamed protein product [Coffea canephora]|uniref:Protein kinase domain-containing protein n=1 Tax=Coffea canephora TaxID=49390 RepID=A0A068UMA0_COFCA|nr:unnamed protein product [Coffea canephora]